MKEVNSVTDDEMILAEAARALDIPYPTLYAKWLRNKFPYERKHGLIWVRLSDVTEALKDYRRRGEPVTQS